MKSSTRISKTETESKGPVSRVQLQQDPFFPVHDRPKESFFNPAILQPKLQIGQPGDPYEREADRVADQVMKMPVPAIQQKCEACKHEERLQKKPVVQRKVNGGPADSSKLTSKIASAKSSGHALPKETRHEMDRKMGADFNGVRIHTGIDSVQMNRDIGSRAFTVGNHIFFNRGEYQPASSKGKWLMAHELVHTIQQGSGITSEIIQKQDDEEEESVPRVPLPHELSREFYMNVLERSERESAAESPSRASGRSPGVRTRGSVDETGRFRVRTRAQYNLAPDFSLGPLQFFETLSVESGVSGGSLEAVSPDDTLFLEQTRIALALISLGWEAGELPGSPGGGLTLETRGQLARDTPITGMPANWSFTPDVRLRWQLFELESPQTPFGRFSFGTEATSAIEFGSEGPSDSHELSAELGWRYRLTDENHPAIRNLDLFITVEGSMEWNELLLGGEVTGRPSFSGTLFFGSQWNF